MPNPSHTFTHESLQQLRDAGIWCGTMDEFLDALEVGNAPIDPANPSEHRNSDVSGHPI